MPHEISLLTNISVALVMAFAGGFVARRLGWPTIVGYLLAGIAIGPFTPGFVGDTAEISQLAELGVIFLMFGVGLHFSLRDLWSVRSVAIPGALLQMGFCTAIGFVLAKFWDWPSSAGLVLGFAISIASTVVLLRGLMDNALLNTIHGRIAVGWLVLEDLATVLILVLLPALFGANHGAPLQQAALALLTAALFVGIMLFVGARVIPWLLTQIAFTRSRELFILAVVAVAVGTAFGSAVIFGVSLALGAFLAGVVLGESTVSHQIGAEVLPFREVFAVLFFVSIGMLVNPVYLLDHAGKVLVLTGLIVVGKTILTILIGLLLPCSGSTVLVVAAGLSQIGEFSFIVGQAGVSLGIMTQEQYSLILAGALLSIMLNPLMFRLLPRAERYLRRRTAFWRLLDRHGPAMPPPQAGITDHVVIVGCGRVGEHVVSVLEHLKVTRLVVEIDADRVAQLRQRGVATLYGDAANSEVLTHAVLDQARALVVTLPEESATEMVVAAARELAPMLPIVARAATRQGGERLTRLGEVDVIQPELEGGLEVMRHTLLLLGYPAVQVQQFTDTARRDTFDPTSTRAQEYLLLEKLVGAVRGIEIVWRGLESGSLLAGKTIAEANLRATTGVSVIALIRQGTVEANPKTGTILSSGDVLGLIGEKDQIASAEPLFAAPVQDERVSCPD